MDYNKPDKDKNKNKRDKDKNKVKNINKQGKDNNQQNKDMDNFKYGIKKKYKQVTQQAYILIQIKKV